MGDLEDKYLTSENMWILNLPKWIEKPVFSIVHFFCKVKYTSEYLKFLWVNNYVFDLDYLELIGSLEFRLDRMKSKMRFTGNTQASKDIEQVLLYLRQHTDAENYVTMPKSLQGKDINNLVNISLTDSGEINMSFNMSDDETDEYKDYIENLTDYEEESWSLFWDGIKNNVRDWV